MLDFWRQGPQGHEGLQGLGRVVFSSSVVDLARGSAERSTVARVGAFFKFTAESLFATLFPVECRLCAAPLLNVSRLPVCKDCLHNLKSFDSVLCRTCGESLPAPAALTDQLCTSCEKAPPDFVRAIAYGAYENKLRDLIHLLKYRHISSAASVLGALLADRIQAAGLPPDAMLVPVPLHKSKFRLRGFNQAEEIARVLRTRLKFRLEAGVLVRKRPTVSQTGMTPLQRRENVRGAFLVRPKYRRDLAGKTIILVDDVLTTGATVNECARVLRRAGVEAVYVATAARVTRIHRAHEFSFQAALERAAGVAG